MHYRAAEAASKAAMVAKMAIETGEAENAAEAAMEYHSAALAAMEMIQTELSKTLERKQKLQSFGVVVETLNGRDPIDVMKHLGKRNGYGSVVWRGRYRCTFFFHILVKFCPIFHDNSTIAHFSYSFFSVQQFSRMLGSTWCAIDYRWWVPMC